MRIRTAAAAAALLFAGVGCTSSADQASDNLATAAENFEIDRRIVFVNGITDEALLEIIGRCSFETQPSYTEVTCLVDEEGRVEKHVLTRSDNTVVVIEQLEPVSASIYRPRVIFRPSVIVPDAELDLEQ